MKLLLPFFLFLMWGLTPVSAHTSDDHSHILIEDAWAPHTGKRTMSAAIYLSITNEGEEEDTLTGVSTDAAAMSTLHESRMEDGIMVMEHLDALTIEAGDMIALEPGGMHLMLMTLSEPLKKGTAFEITLHFENAGDIPVIVEVTGIGGPE